MVNSNKLFSFLQGEAPEAAVAATQMENYIYSDPAAAGGKARTAAEFILKRVFEIEKIEDAVKPTLSEMIYYLTRHEYIKRDIQMALDHIRRMGNKAIHDNRGLILEGLHLHRDLYKVAKWFYETYVTHANPVPEYREPMPVKEDPIRIDLEEILSALEERQKQKDMGEPRKKDIIADTADTLTHGRTDIEETPPLMAVEAEANTETNYEEEQSDQSSGQNNYTLRELISRLKDSSKEAIENANGLSEFKKYLHVDRDIQKELIHYIKSEIPPKLILLSGGVGDGKSHLLAYLKSTYPEYMDKYYIHNDATESFLPEMNALQTLENVLQSYKGRAINTSEHTIVAINLGVLHNFIDSANSKEFDALNQFVLESKVFEDHVVPKYESEDGRLVLFNLSDTRPYELTPEGPSSSFYKAIFKKIFNPETTNPFFAAYQDDLTQNKRTIIHQNFEFLQNGLVQDRIINLVIQAIVKDKLVVSTRTFLNFIADIIIGSEDEEMDNITPNLLFNSEERSDLLNSIGKFDPLNRRTELVDQLHLDLKVSNEWEHVIEKVIGKNVGSQWLDLSYHEGDMLEVTFNKYFTTLIRTAFLMNKDFSKLDTEDSLADPIFNRFMVTLYHFNIGDRKRVKEFYNEFKNLMFKWKGQPKKGFILINEPDDPFKLAQQFTPNPIIEPYKIPQQTRDRLTYFKDNIIVVYSQEQNSYSTITRLEIDYTLYELLYKVSRGYRPTVADEEIAVNFMEFMDRMMNYGNRENEILIDFTEKSKMYKLRHDSFGDFIFERE
ncbi:DNA phosphorothioation-dependent restriction protein DptF [Bhargavaea massiliensis]|uniref:DNA phosphorothioation-dependent restriction protein DptF n=1 Tax=Bhargavaea massiliensis TaxID=2697500 RepID=UPI001BCF7B44|nr:DNA phosphorothioation-dependent restriction protein DptF [Bhargavaea massiliensis]